MKRALICVIAWQAFMTIPAQGAPVKHSMAEFSYLIGDWTCKVTMGGQSESRTKVHFAWLYSGRALKETVVAPESSTDFLTTYDPRSNTFKGVAAMSGGYTIVWENGGMTDNRSSEIGYSFGAGKMIEVSRTNAEKLSDTHYIIRDFMPGQNGRPTDTEDCTKIRVASAGD